MAWSLAEVTILALALAIDAAAVSAALGAADGSTRAVLQTALAFGLAQASMAGLGAWGGAWLADTASAWSPWVAFTLLVLVGGKMAQEEPDGGAASSTVPTLWAIGGLALATSIDALVAGFTLPVMELGLPVALSVFIIGLVTTVLGGLAGFVGQAAGRLAGPWAMKVAGGVLVLLGFRVLFMHIMGQN